MSFNNNKQRTTELTILNQEACARMYASARSNMGIGPESDKEAVMWQNSAAAHFVRTAYQMNLLQPMLESCVYWHARCKG